MTDKQLKELLRIWEQLSDEGKQDVLAYARRLLVNQQIKQNRELENKKATSAKVA